MRPSTGELLALHGLRLKGFAATATIAELFRMSEQDLDQILELAAQDGFTRFRDGSRPGWSLTVEGRKENERLLAVELDEAGVRAEIHAAYEAFRALNPRMLATCTRWQVSDLAAQVLNDHQDPVYDASVIADLVEIHAAVAPICADLGSTFERFGRYEPGLTSAIERIQGGDTDWFTAPTLDSYHTLWFELHEDLLATLGLDRAAEHA